MAGFEQLYPNFSNPEDLTFLGEPYIYKLPLKDVLLIKRNRYADNRGWFQELGRLDDIEEVLGRKVVMRQFQMSMSGPNVLRGIHAEPQDKLITPLRGSLKISLFDFRRDSETFMKSVSFDLFLKNDDPKYSIYIPENVGNSFYVYPIFDTAYYLYQVSKTYDPTTAGMGVRWDTVGVFWPTLDPVLSERDKNLPTLQDFLATQLGR